jgi:hypothetical protein
MKYTVDMNEPLLCSQDHRFCFADPMGAELRRKSLPLFGGTIILAVSGDWWREHSAPTSWNNM